MRPIEPKLKRRGIKKNQIAVAAPGRLQFRMQAIPVEMEWDEDAAKWVTYVPLLNNISTFGNTQTEALDHTREMIVAYVESMADEGLTLPLTDREIRSWITKIK